MDCLRRLMGRAGYDPEYGRKLVRELEGAGLRDVRAEGRTRVYRGGSRASSFLRLSIESLSPALLDLCGLGREELEAGLAAIDDPEMVLVTPPMIAAWGMKPA